jgi:hypothetical protein
MDEGRGKYGCTACNVQEQRPHLGAVLTMDGETFTLAATVTHMMLVWYHKKLICNICTGKVGVCIRPKNTWVYIMNKFRLWRYYYKPTVTCFLISQSRCWCLNFVCDYYVDIKKKLCIIMQCVSFAALTRKIFRLQTVEDTTRIPARLCNILYTSIFIVWW